MQPSTGRIWSANGTTNWSDLTWRGIKAKADGSESITAYGNFDIESEVKHYGFLPGEHHIRLGVDEGTIDEDAVTFDLNSVTLTFTAEADGVHDVKVEYDPSLYDGVSSVTVNGTTLDISEYTYENDNTVSPAVEILVIPDVAFSTNIFVVQFVTQPASGGGGSGGGGGGSGGSGNFVFGGGDIQLPAPPTVGQGLALTVSAPQVTVTPGSFTDFELTVEWEGATQITITEITFLENPHWFRVDTQLPITPSILDSEGRLETKIPVRVIVPEEVGGVQTIVPTRVVAVVGSTTDSATVPLTINLASTATVTFIGLGALVVMGVVGIGVHAARRKGKGRVRVGGRVGRGGATRFRSRV